MAVSGKGPAPREAPYALLTDIPDQEADGLALATKLAKFANFAQGTLAARPAVGASQEGDFYWAKDDTTYGPTGSLWVLFGGKWELLPLPTVTTAMLVNLCVTTAKLAEEGVTTAKIAAQAITEAKLAAALLGPAANLFGLRKIGTGALEAMAGNDERALNRGWYGDGSDGKVVMDGAKAVAGASRAGTVYTLERDVYYEELTVNSTVTLKTNGFLLFCSVNLKNEGVIHDDGEAGVGGQNSGAGGGAGGNGGKTPESYAAAEATFAGYKGGAGGAGEAVGAAGTNATSAIGGAGGKGGGSNSGKAGGAGGTVTRYVIGIPRHAAFYVSRLTTLRGGASGGGGGGSGLGGGAGGAGGGGVVIIAARTIENTGTIRANGGPGADTGNDNGGAGGGGGGGGVVLISDNAVGGTVEAKGGAEAGHTVEWAQKSEAGGAGTVIRIRG